MQKWRSGDMLPSEMQLCREFGVSRGTVVKALNLLIAEGLANRRQGVGTFVSRPALRRMPGFLSSFSETVKDHGRVASQRLLSERELTRAQAFGFGCGEPALLLHRLRFVDGAPWALHQSIIPLAVAERIPALTGPDRAVDQSDFSLQKSFDEAGIAFASARETLNVRLATADEANLLEVSEPTAVMLIHRNSYDQDGRLLASIEAVYVGEYNSYETRLVRTHNVTTLPFGAAPHKMKPHPEIA